MEAVRTSSAIADKVKSQFTVSCLNRMVYFTNGCADLSHYDLEMPNQGFHFAVNFFFRREVEFGNIHKMFSFRNIIQGIPDEFQALPDLFLPYAKAVVGVALAPDRDDKIKIIIGAVRIKNEK